EGAQRRRVSGAVDQFEELLVFEAVYDAEKSLARSSRRKRLQAIGGCQTCCKGFPRGCRRLAIPSKEPPDEETNIHECAHDRREWERTPACRPQKLMQRNTRARPWQING